MHRRPLLLLLLLCMLPAWTWSGWKTLKTEHFTVFYLPGYEAAARRALNELEAGRPRVERLTGNTAWHVPVVIEDVGFSPNGSTDPIGYRLRLNTASPTADVMAQNWWRVVTTHEYAHLTELTNVSNDPADLSRTFGRFYQPNVFAPLWVTEGIAVYAESQLTPFTGRLNQGYFDAYLDACVAAGQFPTIEDVTSERETFLLGDRPYLFGSTFFRYLAQTYGEEKFAVFFTANGGDLAALLSPVLPGVGLDRTARRVFGKPLPALWRDWEASLTGRAAGYALDGTPVTTHGWYAAAPCRLDNFIYYTRAWAVKTRPFATGMRRTVEAYDITTGETHTVFGLTAGVVSALQARAGRLYYAVEELKSGYANATQLRTGIIASLHERTLATGADREVLRAPLRAFAPLPDGSLLYSVERTDAFGSTLYRVDPDTGENRRVGDTPLLIDQLAADDAHVVAVARTDGANFNLYRCAPDTLTFTPLLPSPLQECHATLADGKCFFSANFTGRSAVYYYDFTTDTVARLTTRGYADHPVYDPVSRRLYYFGLTARGFDLYNLPLAPVAFTLPTTVDVPLPPAPPVPESAITRGGYRDNLATLKPVMWYPWLNGTGRDFAGSATVMGYDAVGDFPGYSVTMQYNGASRALGVDAALQCNFFAPAMAGIIYRGIDARTLTVIAGSPLYASLQPGLADVVAMTTVEWDARRATQRWTPEVSFTLAAPTSVLAARLALPARHYDAGWQTAGADLGVRAAQLFGSTLFTASARGLIHPEDGDGPNPRGFIDDPAPGSRTLLAFDVSRRLLPLRFGLWNPQVYLEDITGGLFFDVELPARRGPRIAGGAQASLESSFAFGKVPVVPTARIARTNTGATVVSLFVTLGPIGF
jgi:hypothetical protein